MENQPYLNKKGDRLKNAFDNKLIMNKKIKATCFICDTSGFIPENYQGNIKCPKCKSTFKRTGTPISVVRKQLLEKVDDLEHIGFSQVKWNSAYDNCCCDDCKNRHEATYTIRQAREILTSDFCKSDHFEQGCRCVILACREND